MFRKPTRVSLLSWFPETPRMSDALCTHNTTGFVFNICVVPIMHFALYTQSEYIPSMPLHPEEALYTQSQYTSTMHITSEYEERLRRCQYVPRLSFGRRMLTDDCAPNRFFLMYLFCNESMAIQYLKDIGLHRSKMQCNTRGRYMT